MWRRVTRNPVIHSNLYDDDAGLHRWHHDYEYSSGESELSAESFLLTLHTHAVSLLYMFWLCTVVKLKESRPCIYNVQVNRVMQQIPKHVASHCPSDLEVRGEIRHWWGVDMLREKLVSIDDVGAVSNVNGCFEWLHSKAGRTAGCHREGAMWQSFEDGDNGVRFQIWYLSCRVTQTLGLIVKPMLSFCIPSNSQQGANSTGCKKEVQLFVSLRENDPTSRLIYYNVLSCLFQVFLGERMQLI